MVQTHEKTLLNKLPPFTLALIIISFLLVAGFAGGILWPKYNRVQRAKEERIAKTIVLEEQKKLLLLYSQAEGLAKKEFKPKLPLVERKPLDRNKIATLSNIFKEIAKKHNMALSENSLDIDSLKNSSSSISMDLKFTGNLFDFRDCLISLAELTFFQSIEKIKISTDKSNLKKFSTKIMIGLNKK